MKDLYTDDYQTRLKEIQDTNKWKHILYSRFGRLNIVQMSKLLKAIFRFIAIPIKNPMSFFTKIEKLILKFIWNLKTQNSQYNFEKDGGKKLEDSHFESSKHYYKATLIKTAWYWHKDK